jgi:hypothetical protein
MIVRNTGEGQMKLSAVNAVVLRCQNFNIRRHMLKV